MSGVKKEVGPVSGAARPGESGGTPFEVRKRVPRAREPLWENPTELYRRGNNAGKPVGFDMTLGLPFRGITARATADIGVLRPKSPPAVGRRGARRSRGTCFRVSSTGGIRGYHFRGTKPPARRVGGLVESGGILTCQRIKWSDLAKSDMKLELPFYGITAAPPLDHESGFLAAYGPYRLSRRSFTALHRSRTMKTASRLPTAIIGFPDRALPPWEQSARTGRVGYESGATSPGDHSRTTFESWKYFRRELQPLREFPTELYRRENNPSKADELDMNLGLPSHGITPAPVSRGENDSSGSWSHYRLFRQSFATPVQSDMKLGLGLHAITPAWFASGENNSPESKSHSENFRQRFTA
ncbi:hypothetical protein C8R43DRAFT_961299, partial [Mycena crocata]